jgi:hypothetical protein
MAPAVFHWGPSMRGEVRTLARSAPRRGSWLAAAAEREMEWLEKCRFFWRELVVASCFGPAAAICVRACDDDDNDDDNYGDAGESPADGPSQSVRAFLPSPRRPRSVPPS